MLGASLSEVWGEDFITKPKKSKKKKFKVKPLTPDEMESELLDDNENEELDPRRRLKGMRVSPYTDNELHYQNMKRTVDLDLNKNIERPDKTRIVSRQSSYEDDPDYQEFLEFKRMKEKRKNMKGKQQNLQWRYAVSCNIMFVYSLVIIIDKLVSVCPLSLDTLSRVTMLQL